MTTIGSPPRSPGDWDRPAAQVAADVKALVARQRVDLSVERRQWLLAHPQPADSGHQAEYRHLLHDADPDSTVPPSVVDLIKHQRTAGKHRLDLRVTWGSQVILQMVVTLIRRTRDPAEKMRA